MSEERERESEDNGSEPIASIEESGTGTVDQPDIVAATARWLVPLVRPAVLVLLAGLGAGLWVSANVDRHWVEQKVTYNVYENEAGRLVYVERGRERRVLDVVPYSESPLRQAALDGLEGEPPLDEQWVVELVPADDGSERRYSRLEPTYHFGPWSLLPAAITIAVLLPSLASESAAAILLLYLWLVGGLMGIWSRTGAAQAFAEFMTTHFVKGPRSAKFVSWLMGVIFFQGGTISVVLVGTIVKPVADKERVSHEELAYIVDSTASPIASVLAFNAWPTYVQAFIFIPGVAFLATEEE